MKDLAYEEKKIKRQDVSRSILDAFWSGSRDTCKKGHKLDEFYIYRFYLNNLG